MKEKKDIIVIGHKNPDTDSICAAITYANLKSKLTENRYVAKRAGEVSKETQFVLERFGIEEPEYIEDVRTQVSDIEIKKVRPIKKGISIKTAYKNMNEDASSLLTITNDDGYIEGIISIGDLAEAGFDVYDNRIVSKSKTSFKNIIETLEAKVLVGSADGIFDDGKVFIAANTPDRIEGYIEENDLVIMGNRFETQLFALESGVSCIVLCRGNEDVQQMIRRKAEEKGVLIICTPYDSYTVARLINQSIPVESIMTSKGITTFSLDDFTNDVKDVMAKERTRYFPVLDDAGKYLGLISKRSFLDMEKKKVVLVDHNEKNQAVDGIEYAEIMEIVDHHRLGNLETINPVFFRNQPLGCTCTIIYQMYMESGVEITPEMAGLMCSAIISDTLMFRSPTCTVVDKLAAEKLAEIAGISIEKHAEEMFGAGSNLSERTCEEIFYQDYKTFTTAGMTFGVGQITSMNAADLNATKDRLNPFMEELLSKGNLDMVFFMLTNIIDESTILLFKGAKAKSIITSAYGEVTSLDGIVVKGMVSRKKQLVPDLIAAMQQ
ncbi:MAG: putative manganese-dependent inorganic diphosphatase [Firmicutes bacterium]|nr:putative manganese-dependent inorganic diphosphatase [Bacillota bacterium]